jgi:predicted phosphohydrolase
MRIQQMSDLHLEFNHDFRAYNTNNADILMLNGDICVADYFTKGEASPKAYLADIAMHFFEVAAKEFDHIVYIPGNHEHYHGTYSETIATLKSYLPFVHVIQNEAIRVGKYKILGTTLWTDCNNRDPLTLRYLGGYLNDFKIITKSKTPYSKFLPIDSAIEFAKAKKFIEDGCEGEDNVIVMTHHAPSILSIHSSYSDPMYREANGGYFSNLDQFILDRPQIKLWTHGHTHNSFDYNIGSTRVVCNPHGYRSENAQGFQRHNIIEL